MSQQKTFTLEEANSLLPRVEQILNKIAEKKQSCSNQHDILLMHELLNDAEKEQGIESKSGSDVLDEDAQDLEGAIEDLKQELNEINELGCIVRSVETGWVDFPGELNGEKVFFSWKKGESSVEFYYPLNGDKKDRTKITVN